jgi:S1-C subfamily serine protease
MACLGRRSQAHAPNARVDVVTLGAAITRVQGSVAPVWSDRNLPIGTGFVFGAGLVVTSAHAVDRALGQGRSVAFGGSDDELRVHLDLVAPIDGRYDLAVFSPVPGESLDTFSSVTIARRSPSVGAAIATSGFPLPLGPLVTTIGTVASSSTPELAIENRGQVLNSFLCDLRINPGNSGGPVYRVTDGAVVGVVAAYATVGLRQNSGLAAVVPARCIEELLASPG